MPANRNDPLGQLQTQQDDRRTVARLIAGVPPDGRIGKSQLALRTFLAAIERGQRDDQTAAYDIALDELELAAMRAQQALDTLRAEPSIQRRRELVRCGLGAVIGELDRAFARAEAGRSADAFGDTTIY